MPDMLSEHLARYAIGTREIRRLVRPEIFTEDELRRFSVPLPDHPNENWRSRVRRFMKESGGVHGRRRGIPADFLAPVERVVRAVEDLVGDWLQP